jgi:hypothetical protein
MRHLLLLLAILCFPLPTNSAEYYKWYDQEGNLHITDKEPPSSAREVESSRYSPGESSPAYQRFSHPAQSGQNSPPSEYRQQKPSIDKTSIRIEEERLHGLISRHEKLRDRSSNELGISKYQSGVYTNDKLRENRARHQAEVDKFQRMLIELKKDPYYYFRKHGYIY